MPEIPLLINKRTLYLLLNKRRHDFNLFFNASILPSLIIHRLDFSGINLDFDYHLNVIFCLLFYRIPT
jgi:hypothetical protein